MAAAAGAAESGIKTKGLAGRGGRRRGRNVSEGGAGCRGECAGSVGNRSLMGPLLRVHWAGGKTVYPLSAAYCLPRFGRLASPWGRTGTLHTGSPEGSGCLPFVSAHDCHCCAASAPFRGGWGLAARPNLSLLPMVPSRCGEQPFQRSLLGWKGERGRWGGCFCKPPERFASSSVFNTL